MAEEIINRVAQSKVVTIDLADYSPKGKRVLYDLKRNLWQEMILKEKDFRAFVKEHNWSKYQDAFVAIHCSVDAIIPSWAYMLAASALEPYAQKVVVGDLETLETILFDRELGKIDLEELKDKPVVVKGCGDVYVPNAAFADFVFRVKPYAKSIMYGEPCSTVPVYKKPK